MSYIEKLRNMNKFICVSESRPRFYFFAKDLKEANKIAKRYLKSNEFKLLY